MTEISALEHREPGGGLLYVLEARGHADGSPEACAGVSALLWSLAGWMENTPERGRGLLAVYRLEPGDAAFLLSAGTARARAAARAVWDLTLVGLMQIEYAHPEALRLTLRAGEQA